MRKRNILYVGILSVLLLFSFYNKAYAAERSDDERIEKITDVEEKDDGYELIIKNNVIRINS